jgi:hypothetical protein
MIQPVGAIIDKIVQNEPLTRLYNEEFSENLLKFGSFISIVLNKRINPTFLFVILLKNQKIQKLSKKYFEYNDISFILKQILICYPELVRSKVVRRNYAIHIRKQQREKLRKSNL